MRHILWHLRWLLCWAFGHAGNSTESGYHVCDRCGLHAYWSYRETSGEDIWPEYDNAGRLVNWYWRRRAAQARRRWERDNDIPF